MLATWIVEANEPILFDVTTVTRGDDYYWMSNWDDYWTST